MPVDDSGDRLRRFASKDLTLIGNTLRFEQLRSLVKYGLSCCASLHA